MAKESKKRRLRKAPVTLREKVEQSANTTEKPKRVRRAARVAGKPFKVAARVGRKEYYLPMPDNRLGRFLNKRRFWIPRYFRESWQELRQVTWPTRRETFKLTLAVFLFAIIFGLLVSLTDYGLDKLFRRILLS